MLEYDENGNLIIPEGWEPKSAYFRAPFELAKKRERERDLTLRCPHCQEPLPMRLTMFPPAS